MYYHEGMKKYEYQISYTFKNEKKPGIFQKLFISRKKAEKWLHNNGSRLYWHQMTEINPVSNRPKPIIEFSPGDNFIEKKGKLEFYYEMGMECEGLVLIEHGIHGPPNPDFDSSKPEGGMNFKNFASYDALNFIKSGDLIKIGDGPIVGILKDRDFAARDGYRLSMYPQGFSRKELIDLFGPGNVEAVLWIKREGK